MDMDREYANGAFIAGSEAYPASWAARAAAFRAELGDRARCAIAYGAGPRQRFDLFVPKGTPAGLVVFVHGGYWMAFGREDWSHLAAGPLARGWAVAVPSYTLAPGARIGAMTREIAAAVTAAAAQVAGPVVVAGHSAGGHLAARMACGDARTGPDATRRMVRVVPISPLAELEPLRATQMNLTLGIDAAEAAAESPSRLDRRPDCAALVWVGGLERPAFLWQARTLSEAWGCAWHVAPDRHHFDVIDDLARPDSTLCRAICDGAQALIPGAAPRGA